MTQGRALAGLILFAVAIPARVLALGEFWDYYEKAQTLAKKGNWEDALNEYMNAVVLDKKDRMGARTYGMNFMDYFPNREVGIAYYQLGDSKQAKSYLTKSNSLLPSERAKKFLARIENGEAPESGGAAGGHDTDALGRISAQKRAKEDAVKIVANAKAAMDVGNPQKALDLARKAKNLDPSNGSAMALESRAELALQKQQEKAVEVKVEKGEIKEVDKKAELKREMEILARKRMAAGERLVEDQKYLDAAVEFEGVPKGSTLYREAQASLSEAREKAAAIEKAAAESPAPAKARIKARVAVADFEPVGVDLNVAKAVSENLRTSMIESRKYYVLERALLNKVLEQQKLQLAGITDADQAVEIGKLMAVRFLALGSLTKLGSTLTINFRFIDVETGEAVVARNVRAASEDDLPVRIDELVLVVQDFEL